MVSATTVQSDNYIFDNLVLYNFKMHKDTKLELSEVPIIVISGANGSGKTQILEALILAIGHTPSRLALSTYKELIGPFDDNSKITLKLNNPFVSDRRIFHSSDPELSSFIDADSFEIEVRINGDGTSRRRIIGIKGNKQDVTKRQIQNLMKNIGIYDDTMLNFTEEGYLSSFAEGSPHKKLDTLLVATGLKEVFSSYVDSKKRLEEKEKEYSPLSLQYEREITKLKKLKENFDKLQKKRELVARYEFVERELAWFLALESKSLYENTSKQINSREEELNTLNIDNKRVESEILIVKEQLDKFNLDVVDVKATIRNLSDNKNRYEGQKEEKVKRINTLGNEISTLDEQLKNFTNIQSNEGLERKRVLQNALSSMREKEKQLYDELEASQHDLKRKMAQELQVKERIEDRSNLYGNITDFERRLIKDIIFFKEKLESSKYRKDIIGPIYEIISIKPGFEQYSDVIKAAIGRYLFGFVATTHEAYTESKRIYDEIFPTYKPNFTVGRVLEEEKGPKPKFLVQLSLETKPEGIIDYATNLIEAPFQAKIYLKRFVKTLLASPKISPNLLTDYAKKYNTNILTTDGKSFYLSQEAYSNPPRKSNVKLGIGLSKYQSIERIREQLQQVQFDIEKLTEDKIRINREISDVEDEKRQLEAQLKPWTLDETAIEDEFLKVEQLKTTAEAQIRTEEIGINTLNSTISTLSNDLIEQETILKEKEHFYSLKKEEYDRLDDQIQVFMAKREKLIRQLEFLHAEFKEIDEQYQILMKEAEEKGSPPENIRGEHEEIFSEYNKIKGQLELLEITPDISEEIIIEQEKHVEMIKEEAEKAEEHLNNLKVDLEKRISEWEGGLHHIVDHMNKMLNLLLQDIFLHVSIQIKNYNDERNAGLFIEAETKGDNRKYRQLSGGEKTLLAQAIILALHMISQSPIHAIDEFTQKLDRKNKTLAFSMALLTYRLAKESRTITPQFVLITPSLDDVELSNEFSHKILIESKVKTKGVRK